MKYNVLLLACISPIFAASAVETGFCIYNNTDEMITFNLRDTDSIFGVLHSTEHSYYNYCSTSSGEYILQEYDITNIRIGDTPCDAEPKYTVHHGQMLSLEINGTSEACTVNIT